MVRNLILILGDQLNRDSTAFDGFDRECDVVWMVEAAEESTHVWSHKARIALFLSAMRHFRDDLRRDNVSVDYRELNDADNRGDFASELQQACKRLKPERLVVVQPGEWRVDQLLRKTANLLGVELEIREDAHFYCSQSQFEEHADGRKQLRLEYFYRELRKRHDVLMEDGKPAGGKWNFDADNRGSFKREGPPKRKPPKKFRPDQTTRAVLELVAEKFADHPGELRHFDWPVTPRQAQAALDDFIDNRLANFGEYQDAMWTDEPFLFHSRISTALNLKLLDPRDVVGTAEAAFRARKAPLNAVEGFIRQVLGWREFVRGIYWRYMPDYVNRNALDAKQSLPKFYWTGETQYRCLEQAIRQTLKHGYAHHIQRLMVTGLFAMLYGVLPKEVHEWYLAVYVDAVEWVELPNSLGMSQYADSGVMASKPYAATGKYIDRMSNYCKSCPCNPAEAVGDAACPFTTLYWDFLMRHEETLAANNRMSLQVKNLERKTDAEKAAIRKQAKALRAAID